MAKCPSCGQQINAGAHFCSRCGSVVREEERNAGTATAKSGKRIVGIAIALAVVLIGAVAGFAVYNELNKTVVKEIEFNGDAPVVLGGDTAIIVHGEDGSVLDAYDITLTDEEGVEAAYHVDGASEGYLISDLFGVENGTYNAVVTNRVTGNSRALGNVAVSKGSETKTIYEFGDSGSDAEGEWKYLNTATNQLDRCDMFKSVADELVTKYGKASTVQDPSYDRFFPAGLCFARLVDIDGDLADELVVVPVDGEAIKQRLSTGIPLGYGWPDPGKLIVYDIDEDKREAKQIHSTSGGTISMQGFGKVGFVEAEETGVSLVTYHSGNKYDVWDFSGEHPESLEYEVEFYGFDGHRAGDKVSKNEAEIGIRELCASSTFYLLGNPEGDRDVRYKESFSYEETIKMTDETLAFINDADEHLFVNPHKTDKAKSDKS